MMTRMETISYEIETEKRKRTERPLRLVMLADLHNRLWGEGQEQLLDAIDRLDGDLVVCVGDMLLATENAGVDLAVTLFG